MVERSLSFHRATEDGSGDEALAHLLTGTVESARDATISGARVGRLIGFAPDTHTPLVTYPGQPTTTAVPARATLDLHGAHIGRSVTLLFENDDPNLPIIVGCLLPTNLPDLAAQRGHVEIDADGERLVISASEQVVLRCGKASLTLTKEGKVILQGAYVSSQSSGVLRIKGGSVQIN